MNTNTESRIAVQITNLGSSLLSLALVAGLILTAPSARADVTGANSSLSSTDKDFIAAAAEGGMTEVKLGEIASQTSTRQDIKDFGAMMVKDHGMINDDLKSLAAQKGVTLPSGLDEKHQAMVDKMSALSGPDFDSAYISAMIKAHKKDLKAFQAESAATQEPDLKTFANKTVPTISEHLQHITDIKTMK